MKDSQYYTGYQEAMNDLATKLDETQSIHDMMQWCVDHTDDTVNRHVFREAITRLERDTPNIEMSRDQFGRIVELVTNELLKFATFGWNSAAAEWAESVTMKIRDILSPVSVEAEGGE